MYAEIAFFLPFRKNFTYAIPAHLENIVQPGVRILAQFGKKVLTGFCVSLKTKVDRIPEDKIKTILDAVDNEPILSENDLKLYQWIAEYYLCGLGEVLHLAIPFGSDAQSSRYIIADPLECKRILNDESRKSLLHSKILSALIENPKISFKRLQKTCGKLNIYENIHRLVIQGAVSVHTADPKAKVSEKKERHIQLAVSVEDAYGMIPEIEKRSPKQVAVLLELIKRNGQSISAPELIRSLKVPAAAVKSLAKRGLISIYFKPVRRRHVEIFQNDLPEFSLTPAQQNVYDTVRRSVEENTFRTYLLYGVTASGKTLVYIELAKRTLELGKSVLVLVPEISLTPQITSRFYKRFGDSVEVLHSKISPGERFDAWNNIHSGKGRVVIGARSALFAPLQNIGLIIIDEEHDHSYKQQDPNPRYHARDAAIMKALYCNCPVLLGSATPSLESMYNVKNNKYRYLELLDRVDGASLPHIQLINVIEEKKKKRLQNIFSQTMLEKIEDRLKKEEGVIILHNRRGFSTHVYCVDCGEIETCDNCAVSLVHHIGANQIQCHYCGIAKTVPSQCSKCGSFSIRYFGVGTERVEDELAYHFPDSKLSRIDSDSIQKKNSLSKLLNEFRSGETDILVGTQMVSKGLDFPRVTLVCVVSAETNLWLPDFRADERTFQLLTQVSGRAGRSSTLGEVLIQTQNDGHRILKKVEAHDYFGFYESEIFNRERHRYPPFTRLAVIEIRDENEKKVKEAIAEFHEALLPYRKQVQISPPSTAIIAKLKNFYRYQLVARTERVVDPSGYVLRAAITKAAASFNAKAGTKGIRLSIDIDPQSFM